MINPDINFYIDEEMMPIKEDHVNNSDKDYKINDIIDGFKLTIIRKYVFGLVYTWKKLKEQT
jgi:hypothetical protein